MILTELKERTAEAHDRLEARLPLFRDGFTITDYRALLGRFYGFYAPVEMGIGEIADWGNFGINLAERAKVQRIEADLRALGCSESEIAALPRCTAPPPLRDLSQGLGCMYVLEGATLGGQIIARHLRRSLGVTRERGCSFFGSYGNEVGPMWKAFRRVVAAYAQAHPADSDVIVASAVTTFDAFDRWLFESAS